MKISRPTRAELKEAIGRLQDLVGRARGCFLNDRNPDRAQHVLDALDEAFDLCVNILGREKS
jgi:hypothetical protein